MLRAAEALRTADAPAWLGPEDAAARAYVKHTPASRAQMTRDAVDEYTPRAFVERCIAIVASSSMLPSQKMSALTILKGTCQMAFELGQAELAEPLVHDELWLHRAFSLLLYSSDPENDTSWYFETVPVPDAAVIVVADTARILERIAERGTVPNCYFGLGDTALRRVVDRSIALCHAAADGLERRGVAVDFIDTAASVPENARRLHDLVVGTVRGGTVERQPG